MAFASPADGPMAISLHAEVSSCRFGGDPKGKKFGATGGYLYSKHKEAEQEAYQRGRQDAAQGR
ncbi:MAG: hypothetical protein ACM37Z_00045 [Deltaproteobacteria bacterium]